MSTDEKTQLAQSIDAGSGADEVEKNEKKKKCVYVQANVLSLCDVDTVKQTFVAKATFKLKWDPEPEDLELWNLINSSEEQDAAGGNKPESFTPKFLPKLSFPNADECEFMIKDGMSDFFKVARDKTDPHDMIVYDFQIRCTFRETFELAHFPFDCQDLPITMKLGNKGGTDKNALLPDIAKKNFGKVDLSHSSLTQWAVHPTMVEIGFTDAALSKTGTKTYPLFVIRIKVQRRYQFYLQRMVLIMAALSLSSLTAYSVDVGDAADRLGIDFTLLLTIVAFQQTVTDALPVLPFVTVLDAFVLVSIGFVFMVTVQHALMSEDQVDLDQQLFYIFGMLWIVVHVLFGIYCPAILYKERRKLTMNSTQLKEYLKEEGVALAHRFETEDKHADVVSNKEWITLMSTVQ